MNSFRKSIVVIRKGIGKFDEYGNWIDAEEQQITIKASIQPLNMREMETLPEGQRSSNMIKIYTDTELHATIQSGNKADIIVWLGKRWEILSCAVYQMNIIPHYKAIAMEMMPDATG